MDKRTQAIIFDFDGTLIDSSDSIVETFNTVLEQNHVEQWDPHRIKSLIGRPLREMFQLAFPSAVPGQEPPRMFVGEAVIATDYLKSFLAKFRNLFGGEIKSYQSLLDRARRESLLRILEQARADGYNAICNVRFATADIGGNSAMRRVATVAILASATAYHASAKRT